MYSGVTGEALPCEIYLGVCYYQRLRHMVNDKAQVRAIGKVNNLTRQPVKGRKKHGGIRFGEMERDSLLAHGASFLLHDRLMNCSDRHIALICKRCGGLLPAMSLPAAGLELRAAPGGSGGVVTTPIDISVGLPDGASGAKSAHRTPMCRACGTGAHVCPVPLPYVFRYLVNELAGMNVAVRLELGPGPYAAEGVTPALGDVRR